MPNPLIVSPPPRWSGILIENPTAGKLFLFGGKSTSGSAWNGYMGDVWSFAVSGGNPSWTYISGNGTGPSPRSDMAGSFDGTYATIVGGASTDPRWGLLSDTWSLNTSGTWLQQPLTNTIVNNEYTIPSTLRSASMAYISTSSEALLFGGAAQFQRHYVLDSWKWVTGDPGTWAELSLTSWPSGREYAAMASDGTNVLLYGGKNFSGANSDTWIYTVSGGWTRVSTTTTPGVNGAPPALYGASMVYNAAASKFLLFGGVNLAGQYTNTTYTYTIGSGWAQVTGGPTPPSRAFGQMAYLTASSEAVLFGGLGAISDYADTWSFSSGTWTQLSSPSNQY
jgi:Kelch motif